MKQILLALVFCLSLAMGSHGAAAQDASTARLDGWIAALDSIDTSIGPGTAGGVAIGIVCIFAGPACDAAQSAAQRVATKYRRIASRSWRARGIVLPSKCLTFEIDGAQIDRVAAAYNQARPNLSRGGAYLLTAYDLLGYGFMPVNDLECQDIARKEILRVRGLAETM